MNCRILVRTRQVVVVCKKPAPLQRGLSTKLADPIQAEVLKRCQNSTGFSQPCFGFLCNCFGCCVIFEHTFLFYSLIRKWLVLVVYLLTYPLTFSLLQSCHLSQVLEGVLRRVHQDPSVSRQAALLHQRKLLTEMKFLSDTSSSILASNSSHLADCEVKFSF